MGITDDDSSYLRITLEVFLALMIVIGMHATYGFHLDLAHVTYNANAHGIRAFRERTTLRAVKLLECKLSLDAQLFAEATSSSRL